MTSRPTSISTLIGCLPLYQAQDEPAPAHVVIPWWKVRAPHMARFITDNAGLLLVICAQFVFASMDLSVKLLGTLDPPTPTLELMTLRMAMTVCCCMVYMTSNRISDPILGPKGVRLLLVVRAIAGFLGIFGMFYALNYLSLSDATVITFLTPFAVALAGHLILGERYTKKDAIAGVCSLVGVVLIARPTFLFGSTTRSDIAITSFERLRAVGAALVGVSGNTGTYISMRAIGSRAHPMQIMTFFAVFSVAVGCIATVTTRESIVFPMTWKWISLLLLIGFCGITGQLLLTLGLRYETATRSALAQYCHLLFAAVLQLVVFGTVPSPLSLTGAAIIMTAQAYAVVFAKQKQTDEFSVTASPVFQDDAEERLLGPDVADTSDAELPRGIAAAREEA